MTESIKSSRNEHSFYLQKNCFIKNHYAVIKEHLIFFSLSFSFFLPSSIFAPNYRITTVVRKPQIHGPLLDLALYQSSQFRKFFNTNLPLAGFELGSLGMQAILLPTKPTLLVYITNILVQTRVSKLGVVLATNPYYALLQIIWEKLRSSH